MNKNSKKMMMKEIMLEKEMSKYKHKCKCGHTVILIKKQFAICNHCGRPVFRDAQAEFKYKLGGIRCIY